MNGPRKAKSTKQVLPHVLTREEMGLLLSSPNVRAPTGLRNRCMLEVMYRAGLRVGEVCALTPRDLDLERGKIQVWGGKGGDGTSYLERNPEMISFIHQWIAVRRTLPKSEFLFCTLAGGRVAPRYVQQMIKRMAKRAAIETRVTPHMLRHTFATELLEEGVNIRKVQRALRHKNLATTERYTHVLDSDLQSSIQNRRRPKG